MNLERKATIISSLTAIFLIIIKVIIWIFSGSIAIISSAVDSVLDMFVSMFNFLALKHSEKQADDLFNFWRWKFEALAAFIEWLIIAISWWIILYESILKFLANEEIKLIEAWIIVMIISLVTTWALVYFLNFVYKKTNNLVIKADRLHYKTDLYANAWILISLIIIKFTWFYYIDAIIWGLIAIFIIYSAYEIVKKWFLLLLDIALEEDEVNKIKKAITEEKEIKNYHHLKTRISWKIKIVSFHIVFNKDMSLKKAHDISHKIEEKIRKIDKKTKRDIVIHLDPYDDSALDNLKTK